MRFEDWLPTLVRASTWNGWREDDTLIQLAGHLRGRALQEWNLVPVRERGSYEGAVSALQERLDPAISSPGLPSRCPEGRRTSSRLPP